MHFRSIVEANIQKFCKKETQISRGAYQLTNRADGVSTTSVNIKVIYFFCQRLKQRYPEHYP